MEELLPTTLDEARAQGVHELDVVLVTGDAYVDHPSFGAAMIGRFLQSRGFTVGILAQPRWRDPEAFRRLGRPRLFFGVTAGNLDSMLANATSRGRRRSTDSYAPGGRAGLRPDRATIVYTQRIRETWPDAPVVLGGIEASLRRLAHHDLASDRVRGSILLDAGADLLVYGMGEQPVAQIAQRLDAGENVCAIRDVPSTVVKLDPDELRAHESCPSAHPDDGFAVVLPDLDAVRDDPDAFNAMTRAVHRETNPYNARDLVQRHGRTGVLANAPAPPASTSLLDDLYALPFTRRQHPSCRQPVPALATVRSSITIMRGCFGGCAFCALSLHQGRIVQCRSRPSVLAEVETLRGADGFDGVISDLGGPTANLYGAGCGSQEKLRGCRRLSCLHPRPCSHLQTDPASLLEIMRSVRQAPGVKHVFVASGVRMDVALRQEGYIRELAAHHVGGHLSIAPEHVTETVLGAMRKHPVSVTERFMEAFRKASRRAGRRQYVSAYLMSGHPGSTLEQMVQAALWLRAHDLRPRQVQQFVPAPMTLSSAMYHTGKDPITGDPLHVPRDDHEKVLQKALLLYWDPAQMDLVREALQRAGRADLAGKGAGRLIPG